jgi:hypothetical protein
VIELKPGAVPIYKTLFRMTTLELAELNEHLKELLEKCFIHLSLSPWGAPVCSHGKLMAHVERDKTLSRKVSPDAFLFKATKGNESN